MNHFKHFEQSIKKSIRTCIPVEVESFDSSTMTVNVKPLIKGIRFVEEGQRTNLTTGEIGLIDNYELPSILGLPVSLMLQGDIGITIPIVAGNQGLAMVSDRDIRLWKSSRAISNQASLRLFNINDSFFLPFLPQGVEDYNNNSVEIRNGSTKLEVSSDSVNITGDLLVDGETTLTGDLSINGNTTITGNLVVNGIDFSTHIHSYDDSGTTKQTGVAE